MPLEDLLADLDYIASWLPSNEHEAVAKGAARRAAVTIRNLHNHVQELTRELRAAQEKES